MSFDVKLVSGHVMQVQTEAEQKYWNATRDAYLEDTKFTEKTDLADLDRLLGMELMVFRWTLELVSGKDYQGDDIEDPESQRKNIKEANVSINATKDALAINKKMRDANSSSGSFVSWLEDMKFKAKEFGMMREEQLKVALTLMMEIFGVVSAFERSNEEERRKLGYAEAQDIVTWMNEVKRPEFDAVDNYFKENKQKFWRRDEKN